MFNRAAFNKATFNRAASDDAGGLYATIITEFGMVITPLRAQVPISAVTLAAVTATSVSDLYLKVPISSVIIPAEFAMSGQLGTYVPLEEVILEAVSALTAGSIRTTESDDMTLEGVNLAPGATLIIDTDTLEIEVDGVVNVDCWVTGGTFFQLKEGTNTLNFFDNATGRTLVVTVLWADRFL